jgi:hypothetical protein
MSDAQYTFTSTIVLSEYKTNVTKAALYDLISRIALIEADIDYVTKLAIIKIIENKITEVTDKHAEIVEIFTNE